MKYILELSDVDLNDIYNLLSDIRMNTNSIAVESIVEEIGSYFDKIVEIE